MAHVLAQFRNIDWRSIIDILVVATVLYQFLMLIKGTRAVQLIKGLAVLLVVSYLAEQLGLTTISWILSQVWKMLFVALPVVFQPELRRALEQLGRGKFFTRHPLALGNEALEMVIEEMVRCTQVLSKNRIGALVVIERETGVQDYVETGIKIDGVVSSEFLVNIFIPNTPLHDGAVIVRADRVAAAGCFLPLSENPNIQKELGTRHRAALGLSEVSDAVIVVVSEETGAISVAIDGGLTRFLDDKSLRDLLQRELQVHKSSSPIPFWRGAK
ncbi:adenylate cyclase [Acididesulfobacillus acetoxydans]|uniref:Diadenylate cyclase n=1 Tax=Acididesulfobacillus acetoxydans TaxID=1561005 RepID=A0A8S0W742_9FIRM|nr:diadenylate cyclase CdaA [Acididesulfobacillus acetoxydans]CAA7600349.1 adenylate cyclase [Acididesulfobacillus acetoxydans]CEJ07871.1 TIGR00159 protein [Acididesulfobacillus acetoxydans]